MEMMQMKDLGESYKSQCAFEQTVMDTHVQKNEGEPQLHIIHKKLTQNGSKI